MAPVIHELRRTGESDVRVIVTGQHADLLHPILKFFEIEVDVDLDLMRRGKSPADLAGRMLSKLDSVLADLRPDFVLAQGDTTTAFVSALAAFYRQIPFAHIEAGLRTGDKTAPFPEEMHRVLAGRLADLHFAPTEAAAQALRDEGVSTESVFTTGNTVIDALHWAIQRELPSGIADIGDRKLILVTVHRRENFGTPLVEICRALRQLAARSDVLVVCTMHPNPSVHHVLRSQLGNVDRIRLLPPLEYPEFVACMKQAYFIITDSGGIQEEAPVLGKPVLILRDVTERPEAVEAGTAKLIGTACADILRESERLLDHPSAYEMMARKTNPFGDGFAAERIVATLMKEPVISNAEQLSTAVA